MLDILLQKHDSQPTATVVFNKSTGVSKSCLGIVYIIYLISKFAILQRIRNQKNHV